MNAIDFLVKEHDKVRKILADLAENNHLFKTKKNIFHDLCEELMRHEEMEHKLWYPHFKNSDKLDHTVKHLLKEEKDAEHAIKKIDKELTEEEWRNKFLQFKKDVEHHANDEEEKLFPKVKKILTEEQLNKIGLEMHQFKQKYSKNNIAS